MFLHTAMGEEDGKLWCGIENNYDLLALVDLTTVDGVFDSRCHYLSQENARTSYGQSYRDEADQPYIDRFGCIPFFRSGTKEDLPDRVYLDPAFIDWSAMERLGEYYEWFQSKGARVYVSCACVNLSAVPEGQRGNAPLMDRLLREAVGRMEGAVPISSLEDYLYQNLDFYDTNYHLVTQAAKENTALWFRDLRAQMERDGVWEGGRIIQTMMALLLLAIVPASLLGAGRSLPFCYQRPASRPVPPSEGQPGEAAYPGGGKQRRLRGGHGPFRAYPGPVWV